jgi:hypothetical protein
VREKGKRRRRKKNSKQEVGKCAMTEKAKDLLQYLWDATFPNPCWKIAVAPGTRRKRARSAASL